MAFQGQNWTFSLLFSSYGDSRIRVRNEWIFLLDERGAHVLKFDTGYLN
jgi:hypothetical protein